MTTKRNAKKAQHHLSIHMLRTNQRVESSQPQKLDQTVVHALLSTLRKTHDNEAHSRNGGTPSFQRKQKMSKICSYPVLKNANEENNSELTQHASTVRWQLNATRPSTQSSRKSATTSLDQSCPKTSMMCGRRKCWRWLLHVSW